jgi:hypothetical protein
MSFLAIYWEFPIDDEELIENLVARIQAVDDDAAGRPSRIPTRGNQEKAPLTAKERAARTGPT